MAIVEMKKVFIFSCHSWGDELVEVLHKLGLVQICQIKRTDGKEEVLKEIVIPERKNIDENIDKLQFLLNFVPPLSSEKKDFIQSMVNAKKLVDQTELEKSISGLDWENIFSRCVKINRELEEIRKKKESQKHLQGELEPWVNLGLRLDEIKDTGHTFIILGKINIESFQWLNDELASKTKNFVLKGISENTKDKYFILLGTLEEKEIILHILKKLNYSNVVLPKTKDIPAKIIIQIENDLQELSHKEKILLEERNGFSKYRENLFNLFDYYLWQKDRLTVKKDFGQTEKTIVIDGWIKATDTSLLKEKLNQITPELYIYFRDPIEGEDVPTALKNNPVFAPFELIVELYGMPSYYEKDPTPLIAIFFSLIFGFALGDVVYGLVLSLITFKLARKYKISESDKKGIRLFFWVGITTIIIGALTGTWMGDLPDRLNEAFGFGLFKKIKDSLMVVDPLNQLIPFICIALAVGVIHVFCGLGFKAYQNIINGKFFDALFDQIVWILLVGGLVALGISKTGIIPANTGLIFSWIAKISALIIILFAGRDVKNPFGRVGLGAYKLYSLSAYIGDILSYVRLVALSLAGSIIAMVFNIMAFLLKGSYIGIIFLIAILLGGHLFNLVINMLGAFVHTARLHYVEFFSKFYDNGGRPFRPFRQEGRYIIVDS